jgi:TRAP-type C4-dicarboxylate transport system permease small subunit
MKKTVKWLDNHLEEAICGVLLSAMTIIIMLQIICRLTGLDVSWNEELARYLFVWLIYIGCAYAVKMRKHIRLEIVLLLLGRRGNLIFNLISNLLFMLFALIILYEAMPLLYKMHFIRKQFSPAMRLPMSFAFASVVIGFLLTSFRLVQDTCKLVIEFNKGESSNAA